jgi:hypothetical protein
MPDIEAELAIIRQELNDLHEKVGQLLGGQHTMEMLIKFVILPLVVILGGLVGIKIILP